MTIRLRFAPSLRSFLAFLAVLLGATGAWAAPVPLFDRISAIAESSNWSEIEGLGEGDIHCFDLAEDGVVWIGVGDRVLRYDGVSFREYGEFSRAPSVLRGIGASREGEVYVLAHTELYRLQDGVWNLLAEMRPIGGRRFVEDGEGRLWFAGNGRVVSVRGDEVVKSEAIASRLLEVELDREGQLWALAEDGSVFRCARDAGAALVQERWDGPGAHRRAKEGMIEATRDGLVWVVDSVTRRPPRFYDPQRRTWTMCGIRDSGGDHENLSIVEHPNGDLLISGPQSISYQKAGRWGAVPTIEQRFSDPTTLMNVGEDGYLWCLQSGRMPSQNRLLRIDYTGERWSGLEGLNFQCDWGEGKRCFLSVSGELAIHHAQEDRWEVYAKEDGLIDTPVVAIVSQKGELWVAGAHDNTAAVSRFDGRDWRRETLPSLGRMISRFSARSLADGSLVFAYGHDRFHEKGEGGIVRFWPDAGGYRQERLQGLFYNRILSIQENAKGTLFYSKNRIFEYENGSSKRLQVPLKGGDSSIDEFHFQGDEQLWYCNWGQGVHFFDGEDWQVFTEKDGLSSNYVSNLLVLEEGIVYALTTKGLDRFEHGQWQAVAGPDLRGIRDGSSLRISSDGSIWVNQASRGWHFGHNSRTHPELGFRCWRFQPDRLAPETEVSFAFEPSKYSDSAYVSWAGVDPWAETSHRDLQFSYQIDGGEWSPYGLRKSMHLAALRPGEHIFRVKARDRDGNVDTSPAELAFSVYFPFWESRWFLALSVAVPLVMIGLLLLLLIQRLRHMAELEGLRTRFLMNISHELRSPLSLIMMPLEKWARGEENDERSKDLAMALRSSRRLNQLVDQLLDLHKARAQKYKLNPKNGDIVRYTRTVVADFENLAASREQSLRFFADAESYATRFDEDIYRKMLDNLVLNAIKHSPPNTEISVSLATAEIAGGEGVRLVVEDDGAGIKPSALKRIFEPFYNDSKPSSPRLRSFGIGLALVKELVDFCGATISVESPVKHSEGRGYGSRFAIEFPEMPRVEAANAAIKGEERVLEGACRAAAARPAESCKESGGRPLVLLVDDHDELRDYLAAELGKDFAILQARGSREGLAIARERLPDLIVSDVLMPEMDGVDFCDALKEDSLTSHIPIILQTSLASEESEAAGFEAGAIDYVSKPISVSLLRKRIASHLEARKRYAAHLRNQLLEPASEQVVDPNADAGHAENDADLKFVKRMQAILAERWNQVDFNTDQLASELGMARSSLYSKCKAIANITPAELIKSYRLSKAKDLLKRGKSVTEVAGLVGYLETRSFYRAFKKRFHCTPSEFQKEARV
ncbi:ATP-binding protein [Pelagicoccus sp. SDUM812005]|uniref:ATP-binding protein n=1 Tax=Pelagicoccus sp. SDUM812005 TaxID=3041257 RepID=UPI0028102977|nr:ATP-binding protein [Pelagicoccus sp. SDUM812005]MDQ8179585.1 response regulator [Pelagicoccus sp. SDUM812005]